MNYADGQAVRLGDHFQLGEDRDGIVVCSIDDDTYSDQHPREAWGYLRHGVMIEFPTYGLIHYVEAEPDLKLLARAGA